MFKNNLTHRPLFEEKDIQFMIDMKLYFIPYAWTIYKKAKLLRGWGRSSSVFNESEEISKRFNIKVDGIEYDSKYIFNDIGYNFFSLKNKKSLISVQQITKS